MFVKKLAFLCLFLLLAVSVNAQVSGGISISDDGLHSFYIALGQTYAVPEREVIIIHERQIPDDEIPVVFFIANRAHVRREVIVERRLAGQSWMEITLHYNLDPSIFYIELDGDPGPEYGRAYGHWKQHPRHKWRDIRFEDDDIVKMVNLRFVSKHYGVRPDEVVRLRGEHGNFVKVTHVFDSPEYRSKHGGDYQKEDHWNDNKGRGHDDKKDNGKKKGHGGKGKGHNK